MTTTANFLARAYDAGNAVAWVLAALWGLGAVYVLTNSLIEGPKVRALAEQARAEEIDRENRQFCQKYGAAPGTDAYRACALDLMDIRNRQAARLDKENDIP